MSLLARITDLQPNAVILSGELDNEFNNLVNALNGTTTTKNLLVKSNDNSLPVLALDALGTNLIQVWRLSGTDKARVNNNGSIESLISTGTAPFIAASATVCTGLNADKVDGFDFTGNKSAFSFGWFYSTPPGATETAPSVHIFRIPFANTFVIEKIGIQFTGGSHTSGGVLTFTLKRRNAAGTLQTDIGTITLDNTNNTVFVAYTNDIADYGSMLEADIIYPILTTRSGTITEANVTVTIMGYQTFRA